MPYRLDAVTSIRGCTTVPLLVSPAATTSQFEMNADDEFGVGHPRQTQHRRRAAPRARSAVVDPRDSSPSAPPPIRTQPIEGHYKLTRGCLEALTCWTDADRSRDERADDRPRSGRPAGRDAARPDAPFYMSVPTVDEEAWRILEPGTRPSASAAARGRELVDAGDQRRRPDGAHRAWLLIVSHQARTNGESHRRSRRALRRLQRDASRRTARGRIS